MVERERALGEAKRHAVFERGNSSGHGRFRATTSGQTPMVFGTTYAASISEGRDARSEEYASKAKEKSVEEDVSIEEAKERVRETHSLGEEGWIKVGGRRRGSAIKKTAGIVSDGGENHGSRIRSKESVGLARKTRSGEDGSSVTQTEREARSVISGGRREEGEESLEKVGENNEGRKNQKVWIEDGIKAESRGRRINQRGFGNLFTIFVDGIPDMIDAPWLRFLFKKFGPVRDVFIPSKRRRNTNTRFGFVRFSHISEARMAVEEMDGAWRHGNNLKVRLADQDLSKRKEVYNKQWKPGLRVNYRKSYRQALIGEKLSRSFGDDLYPSKPAMEAIKSRVVALELEVARLQQALYKAMSDGKMKVDVGSFSGDREPAGNGDGSEESRKSGVINEDESRVDWDYKKEAPSSGLFVRGEGVIGVSGDMGLDLNESFLSGKKSSKLGQDCVIDGSPKKGEFDEWCDSSEDEEALKELELYRLTCDISKDRKYKEKPSRVEMEGDRRRCNPVSIRKRTKGQKKKKVESKKRRNYDCSRWLGVKRRFVHVFL